MTATKQDIPKRGRPKNTGVTSRALSREEIKRLLTVTQHTNAQSGNAFRNAVMVQFGIYTSARISEIANVKIKDVIEDDKVSNSIVFSQTKSKKSRRIPLNPVLQSLLRRFLYDNPYQHTRSEEPQALNLDAPLFPSQKGGHFHPTAASKLIKTLLVRAGIPNAGASHVLRKTGLTLLHEQGVSLRTLQEISGHSNIATLQTYLSASEHNVAGAINSLKL